MTLSAFLHFRGECAEALAFYAGVFDDPAPVLMPYSEAPGGGDPDRIMYGHVATGEGNLMASDYPAGEAGDAQAGVSVCFATADADRAAGIFAALAEGGAILEAWGPSFFSAGFGMLKDRFGTHWIVMVEATEGG